MQLDGIAYEFPKAVINWYNFDSGARVLLAGDHSHTDKAIQELLIEENVTVDVVRNLDDNNQIKECYYDYILLICMLEKTENPVKELEQFATKLKSSGKLLLCMNNRLGLRYFCGDRDPYTKRNFDGIENYQRAYAKKEDSFQGRMYDKAQITKMLQAADLKTFQFFSVFPDLHHPTHIFAEDYLPNEDLANRIFPEYNYPDSVFLEEESLYQHLIDNNMFHQMANAYIVECSVDGNLSDVKHVTSSLERGHEDALLTIIHESGLVEKRCAYPEGEERLEQLIQNAAKLKAQGVSVVELKKEGKTLQMPFIQAETGQRYLKRLLLTDKEAFLMQMDHFHNIIMQSSEIISPDREDGEGAVLREGFLDMVPLNSFLINGEFVFFDQEFCSPNCPANIILMRMICTFYSGNVELIKILPMEELMQRYNLITLKAKWQEAEGKFLHSLRKEEELCLYNEEHRRNNEIVNANRQRMNYSESEYQRLFIDILSNVANKKLVIFGTGAFSKRFLGLYGKDYEIAKIIDNNESKWGELMNGIPIQSPTTLTELSKDEYKVIICIKNYLSVTRQLDEMGIKNYGIFDSARSYAQNTVQICINNTEIEKAKKKYHIGYVAGVFDLFHTGHVNLLRKAKEQCDYLIVGVISDEGVYRQKKKYPTISCKDRVEVIKACRYADQVEALPDEYNGIRDAYKRFKFDCQFSGDDHGENNGWLADKHYLEKMGADLVFFSYTEGISSSMIQRQLREQ